jgi:hypothetical protein
VSAGDFDRIFAALSAGKVRYLVVGGVAVVLHGHPCFTADLDLVVALDPDNARAAIAALATLGYRPRAPVDGAQFADPAARERWIEEEGLTDFTLWSPDHPAPEVDLFVLEPFPFEAASARGRHRRPGRPPGPGGLRRRPGGPQARRGAAQGPRGHPGPRGHGPGARG